MMGFDLQIVIVGLCVAGVILYAETFYRPNE